MAELDELALDAPVAPAGILPREAQDEGLDLGGDGRAAAGMSAPDRPLPPDQFPMPLQHGVGFEQEEHLVQMSARAGSQLGELGGEHGQGQLLPAREAEGLGR